jgi:hypothetical protein
MTEPMVTLPEPRPEDDEDVVWGLSTASALWQRGERQDAIVWLRRAAEAATAAGQDFRASELGMYASEIEDKLQQGGDRPSTTPITEFEEVIDEPTIPVTAHASAHPPPPPSIVKSKRPPPPPPSVPHLPSSHPAAPSQFPAQSTAPPSQVPATLDLNIQPPPSTMPPVTPGSPMSGLMAIASTSHPSSQQPSTVPSPPSVAKPPARHAVPAPPSSQPTAVPGLRLQPRSIPPVAASPKPTSPPQERMPTAPASHEHPLAQTLATPGSSVAQVTVSQPIIAHASNDEEDSAAAPAPTQSHSGRKKPPRAPILDPWGEEAPPSSRAAMSAQFPTMARERAEEILLSVRARPASTYNEGDDVVTSAAPIEDTLRRGKPGAPAPPSAAARRASEPGHLERAAPIVSKVQPSGAPPAPSTPPAQAAPPSHASLPPVPLTPAPLLQHASPPPPEAQAQARPPSEPPIAAAPPPVPRTPRPLSSAPAPDFQGPKPLSIAPPASPPRIPTPPPPPPKPASVAPPRIPTAPPPPPPEERAYLGDVALDEVDAFADLPPDAQRELARVARVEELGADEEVSGFGAALLLEGEAMVCATLVDAAACRVVRASIVPSRGTLPEPVSVRVVVGPNGGKIAVWEQTVIDEALRTCPWVLEELSTRADRLQALAGACIGPLGDVDETFRNMLLERLTLRVAAPHERLAHKGDKLSGIVLVGAGSVDLLGSDADSVARPGDFLFPRAVLEGHPSPLDAHAGSAGALLLIGDRQLAQELFVTAPPLVAVLSGES